MVSIQSEVREVREHAAATLACTPAITAAGVLLSPPDLLYFGYVDRLRF